jgi:peptidoglycan hydrolase CwlO-like protein
MESRGNLDLTRQIEELEEEVSTLLKQKAYLQDTCRRAGEEIKDLKSTVQALENTVEQVLNPLRKDGLL